MQQSYDNVQNDEDNEDDAKIQKSYPPMLGQFSRFFGLLFFAICWVSLLTKGSQELFGSQPTMHELTIGSNSLIDFGFGGDYLGWGEVNTNSEAGLPEFEFGEIADLIHDLVTMWHSTITSWNETFHSLHLHSHLFKGVVDEPVVGVGFDPELFIHLESWLGTTKASTLNPELLSNLSKAAENAAILLAEKAKAASPPPSSLLSSSPTLPFSSSSASSSSSLASKNDKKKFGSRLKNIFNFRKKRRVQNEGEEGEGEGESDYFDRSNILKRRYLQAHQKAQARVEARKIARELKHSQQQSHSPSSSTSSSSSSSLSREQIHCRNLYRPWTWLRYSEKCPFFPVNTSRINYWNKQRHQNNNQNRKHRDSRNYFKVFHRKNRDSKSNKSSTNTNNSDSSSGSSSSSSSSSSNNSSSNNSSSDNYVSGFCDVNVPTAVCTHNPKELEEEVGSVSPTPSSPTPSIDEFRKRQLQLLREEMIKLNPNYVTEASQGAMSVDDVGLCRYLDVALGELEYKGKRVAEMVLDTISWRVANNITNMRKDRLLEAAQDKQAHVFGYDKEGHAVVVYTPTVDSNSPTELAIYYLVFNLELAIALGESGSSPTKQKVSQYTFIVDLANIGTMPPLRIVKASFEVMGRHYPMRPHKILLVHGGYMVQWIWRVLEPLIDQRTREKVTLVPESTEHAMLSSMFDPMQLEKRFKSGKSNFLFNPTEYINRYS